MIKRFCFLSLLFAVAVPAGAQEAPSAAIAVRSDEPGFSAERPGYTNGTDTIPPGSHQIELGVAYANGAGGYQRRVLDGSQIRFPMNGRTEWRIGIPAYIASRSGSENVSGFADFGLSVKWRFLDAAPRRPSLALIGGSTLPTGKRDVGSRYFQPFGALQVADALSDKWGLSGSVTYADARDGDTRFDQAGFSVNVGYALNNTIGLFSELYRLSATGADTGGASFFDGGATFLLTPKTQFDINGGVGLSGDDRNSYFVGAGIVRRW